MAEKKSFVREWPESSPRRNFDMRVSGNKTGRKMLRLQKDAFKCGETWANSGRHAGSIRRSVKKECETVRSIWIW
jgi:hypothetical protein